MPKNLRTAGVCAYCSMAVDERTEEHVVAKCFYVTDPKEHIKVPVCLECNNKKSESDGYLRNVFALSAPNHPEAKRHIESGKVARSIELMSVERRRSIASVQTIIFVKGQTFRIIRRPPIDEYGIAALKLLVRGLYYYRYGQELAADTDVNMTRLVDGEQLDSFDLMLTIPDFADLRSTEFGNSVYRLMGTRMASDPQCSIWFMSFYESIYFVGTTRQNPDIMNATD